MNVYRLIISALLLTGLIAGSHAATDAPAATIRVANAVLASAYADIVDELTIRHEKMADLAYMVGIWNLTSKTELVDGSLFEAIGTRSCVWVLDRTAIRCDDSVDEIRATEDFPGLYDNHDQLFYLTFNEAENRYEYTYMSPTSADKEIYRAEFDERSKTMTKFIHLDDSNTMRPVKIWQVNANEIREQAVIRPQTGDAGSEIPGDSVETILNRKVPEASLTKF